VLLDEIQEGSVVGVVDFLALGLFQWLKSILMPVYFFDLDVFISVDAELELAFNDVVLHLAGNDGVFACLELVPHVHLPSYLEFYVFSCGFLDAELLKHFLLVCQVEGEDERAVAELFIRVFFTTVQSAVLLDDIHEHIGVFLLYGQDVLMVILDELLSLLGC
jgi:hypothetical protein